MSTLKHKKKYLFILLFEVALIKRSFCEEELSKKFPLETTIPISNLPSSSTIPETTFSSIIFTQINESSTDNNIKTSSIMTTEIPSFTTTKTTKEKNSEIPNTTIPQLENEIQSTINSDDPNNTMIKTTNDFISHSIHNDEKISETIETTNPIIPSLNSNKNSVIFTTFLNIKSTISSTNYDLTSIPDTSDNQILESTFETIPQTIDTIAKETINTEMNSPTIQTSSNFIPQLISTIQDTIYNSEIKTTIPKSSNMNIEPSNDIIYTSIPHILTTQIETKMPKTTEFIFPTTQINTIPKSDDTFTTIPSSKELPSSTFYETENEITTSELPYSTYKFVIKENPTPIPIFPTTQIETIPSTSQITDTIFETNSENVYQSSNVKESSEIYTTPSHELKTTNFDSEISLSSSQNIIAETVDTTIYIPLNNTSIPKTTQILKTIPSTFPDKNITSIPNIIPTSIINNTDTPTKGQILFLLQAQIINKRLYIFVIKNFQVTKTQKFIFIISKYISHNLRNLQNNIIKTEIVLYPKEDYDGYENKIISLISEEEVNEERIIVEGLKNNEDIEEIILNDNYDLLDTEKVREDIKYGGIDYFKITENNEDYNVYQYNIISSTIGCEFTLNSEDKINQNNKTIILSFLEVETNNRLETNCILSNNNDNKINCFLSLNISGTYTLEPYVFSDQIETITIIQKNENDIFSLKCNKSGPVKPPPPPPIKKNEKISIGGIVAIIVAVVFSVISYGVCYL